MNTLPFSELVEINPRVKMEKAKEYPFIEMGIVEPGRRYVRGDQNRIFQNGGAKFLPGDTLFARITPCLENGKIAQYKAPCGQAGFGSTEFFVIRARPRVSDSGFVYYLAKSDLIRKPAEKSMSGASGRQRADLKSILDLKVPSLPLPTQRKIAAILSAYDDLIENNLRRIKILEEMAQNLYREWFVKFRFPACAAGAAGRPGHQHTRFTDSPLGRIPEGWEVTTIGNIVSYINRGLSPKYNDSSNSVVINQKCIRNHKLDLDLARRHSSRIAHEKYIQFGDILINSTGIGTLGRVAQVYRALSGTTVDTHVTIVRPRIPEDIDYLGLALMDMEAHFDSLGAGATGQTELRRDRIGETAILLPTLDLRKRFSLTITPIRSLVITLLEKNTTLRRTRDLLLPRLISGEVDVSELDIAVPEEVAA